MLTHPNPKDLKGYRFGICGLVKTGPTLTNTWFIKTTDWIRLTYGPHGLAGFPFILFFIFHFSKKKNKKLNFFNFRLGGNI